MSRFSYHVPILGYHRVGPFKGDHVPTVSPETFERQLSFLARRRYQVVDLAWIAERVEQAQPIPRRTVALTFDDGYEEMSTVVWPLLKRFRFPATAFVTPSEVGLPGFATWDQLIAMDRDGITIGSHTTHHSYLPLVKGECLREELVGSKQAIEASLGRPVHFLSYPVGGFTPEAQAVVREAGYRAACTTNRAFSHSIDLFALRRVKVTEKDRNLFSFWVKVSGYYDLFRQLTPPS